MRQPGISLGPSLGPTPNSLRAARPLEGGEGLLALPLLLRLKALGSRLGAPGAWSLSAFLFEL